MSTQMTHAEYMSYAAEITTLKRLLEGLPEERATERYGFEYRLERAQQKIEGVPVPPRPRKWTTSFRGEPVQSGAGINANFGAEAVTLASDSIRLATAGLTGDLEPTGQIPRNALGQPIITGVTLGSFGFVMELPPSQDSHDIPNPSEEAVNRVQDLLRSALEGNDDDFTIAASSIHPRAVNKAAEFLDLMRRRRAQFTMEYEGDAVRFQTRPDVYNAHRRLVRVTEDTRTDDLIGRMIGVIPTTRQFQINPDDGDPIRGTIGPEIRDTYDTAARFTNRRVRARVRTVRAGRGAPRHTLLAVSQLPDQENA